MGYASKGTNYQYNSRLCLLSLYSNYSYLAGNAPVHEATSAMFRCQRISTYWIESMEWIRDNTPEGSRVISWWDYGHWINYFGLRNAVLRNEHVSHTMIGATANMYLDSTPEELKAYMLAHDSEYALFDIELVYNGGMGGKYGALNYLSCAYANETNVSQMPGQSKCESEHLWEVVFVTDTPCTISKTLNRTGATAYTVYEDIYRAGEDDKPVYEGTYYRPYYPPYCTSEDPNAINYCNYVVKPEPTYCVGDATMADGSASIGTYLLDQKLPNGDLKLSKGLLQFPSQVAPGVHFPKGATMVTLFYTHDPVWLDNGEVKAGYEDRTTKFYDSALYQAIFLDSLPGFEKAYATPDGAVKIFKAVN